MSDRIRILIADDDANVAKAINRLLQVEKYECDCVPDGDSTLERMRVQDYNLLIADIGMPGNDGLELVRKAATAARGMPVILITGQPSIETAVNAVELPVFAYVLKPFDPELLIHRVRAGVKWNQAYQAIAATEARLAESITNTAMMNSLMAASNEGTTDVRVQSFFAQTLGSIAGAIMDLNQLFNAMTADSRKELSCNILGCPRAKEVEESLANAVEVLRASKEKCKSKEIATLRRSLENELLNHRRRIGSPETQVL